MQRFGAAVAAVGVVAAALALTAAPASSATPVITPAATSVGRGATLALTAKGCAQEHDGDGDDWYQYPEVVLITGTGASARLAAISSTTDGGAGAVTVPGWVDPAQPAVLAGRCVRISYHDGGRTRSIAFTYPDVSIDVTAGSAGATAPTFTLSRATAASGQVVVVTGSGCAPGSYADAVVFAGGDLSGRGGLDFVAGGSADRPVGSGGTFTIDVPLLGGGEFADGGGSGNVPEGSYAVAAVCSSDQARSVLAAPQALSVVGTNPSDAVTVEQAGTDRLVVRGEGCTGDRQVVATFTGYAGSEELGQQLHALDRSHLRGRAVGSRVAPDLQGRFTETAGAAPAADGTWSIEWAAPSSGYDLSISVDCGDPVADGFRYVPQYWYESNFADVWLDRASPAASPTGGPVVLHFEGDCDDPGTARITDAGGHVLAEGSLSAPNAYGMTTATVTAPAAAGRYRVDASCGGKASYPEPYEVFAPTTLADAAPLPAEPTTGWPSTGEREVYHGRIGPITLPAEDMGDMGSMASGRSLGPSGIFVDVPRPSGDFAITKMDFDLVGAEGMTVPQDEAHLHHFVIGNTSSKNPACPNGTFGLPGEIVGAAGAEKTVLDMADPYGLVVKGTDRWTGVYDLMNRTDATKTVYLTYDLSIRRDVQNVRPITRYFGSATGCSSFTWTVDGSGTPDVQRGYVTMAADGVLLGAGGHIHNGGLYTDVTDDRGRRLCRSTLELGTMPIGHGGMEMGADQASRRAAARDITATTVAMPDEPTMGGSPPESYADDLEIEGITTCRLREQVRRGERIQVDAVYDNARPRSGVMGIYSLFVWQGGGPATPTSPGSGGGAGGAGGGAVDPASGATAIPGHPSYAG